MQALNRGVATQGLFKKQLCHGGRNEDLYITCFDPCTYGQADVSTTQALESVEAMLRLHRTSELNSDKEQMAVG